MAPLTSSTDILVYIAYTTQGGKAKMVKAECQALVDTDADPLLDGFQSGYFFQATDMNLGLSLTDAGAADGGYGGSVDYALWRENPPRSGNGSGGSSSKGGGKGNGGDRFRVEPDVLGFTRLVDCASPVLLQHCLLKKELDSVVMVKRHAVGMQAAGSGSDTVSQPLGFLRFELSTVTVRSLDWSDGQAVTEKCSFSFQGLKLKFLQRDPSGAVAIAGLGTWQNKADATSTSG